MYVYLAGPYTSDPEANTRYTIALANRVLELGYTPFVPHLTHFWHLQTPKSYEEWMDYDDEWLQLCDVLLRLPGASAGADVEKKRAEEMGIPVVYSIDALVEFHPVDIIYERIKHQLGKLRDDPRTNIQDLVPIMKQMVKLISITQGKLNNAPNQTIDRTPDAAQPASNP